MQAPQKAAVIDGSSLNLNFVQLNIYRRGLFYSTPHVCSGGYVRPSLLPIHSHGALRIFYSTKTATMRTTGSFIITSQAGRQASIQRV